MQNIEIKKSRLALIYILIAAFFVIILGRMSYIVIFGDKLKFGGIYDSINSKKRGDIYDRNGVLLATELKTKSLYVSSVLVRDIDVVARGLSSIFSELSYEEIHKKISHNKSSKQWILIRRNLTPNQVLKVQNLKLAGLIFENDRIRIYPQKSITSHYVGYVDLDRHGLSGIEMQYDRKLMMGENVTIALDVRVQDILHDELVNGIEEFKAKAAAGVVTDINTGEILALSSLPDFDPNLQYEASPDQRFNRVTNGVYELGSVFKIFTNANAFEDNLVKTTNIYNVRDPIKYGRFSIKDDHPYKDEMTVMEIFSHSSNIGTVKIAEKIGASRQKDFLENLGFLKKLDAEFPGLGRPIYPKNWRDINLFTISYGHGIAITPLHLAMAAGAIANGGMLYKPLFTKANEQPKGTSVIKESTSAIMRELLRNTAIDGTGKKANIEGYEVGGKTGTANRAEGGGYNERLTMASFVAVFPISQPKYLVYVIFDRPNYIFNTGGMVAAPVAGRVVKNIAPLLEVKPKSAVKMPDENIQVPQEM